MFHFQLIEIQRYYYLILWCFAHNIVDFFSVPEFWPTRFGFLRPSATFLQFFGHNTNIFIVRFPKFDVVICCHRSLIYALNGLKTSQAAM